MANTKTTLPWLLAAAGAPGWIISFLVPIRESGSMLPQLAIGAWVRQAPVRKWFYVAGALAQAIALFAAAICLSTLSGLAAGLGVLAAVVAFSLARGFCSIASKDVMGKTVPKTRRGRVNGLAASIAGAGTLVVAVLILPLEASETIYLVLVVVASLLWLLGALLYASIDEEPGASEGGVNGLQAALESLRLLLDDVPFRNFVLARALLVGTGLAAPFLVIMARERSDVPLSFFLIAQGSASLLSGNLWGRLADRSSRQLLRGCAVAVALLGIGVFLADRYTPELTASRWFLPVSFFLLMMLHDGVRLGRKTYLLDLAGGSKRTDYVAVSNTLMGVVLLAVGAFAALVQSFGNAAAVLFCSLLAVLAAAIIQGLPEVQQDGK